MEKSMKNKITLYLTALLLCLFIAIPSTNKVIKKHNTRLLENTIKRIEEAAKYCYYNDSCVEEQITLEELYEKTSLPRMNNPVTKEVYNEKSYIQVKENFKFYEIKNK